MTDVQRLVWVDREGTESVITQEELSFGTPRISPNGPQIFQLKILELAGGPIYAFARLPPH